MPAGDKVIIRDDRIILRTAGQVTETATSANPMLQQVALMIRASMTGDLSQFGEGWQIGYDETEGAGTVRMVPLVAPRPQIHRLHHAPLRLGEHDARPDGAERNRRLGHSVYEFRDKRFDLRARSREIQPLTPDPDSDAESSSAT